MARFLWNERGAEGSSADGACVGSGTEFAVLYEMFAGDRAGTGRGGFNEHFCPFFPAFCPYWLNAGSRFSMMGAAGTACGTGWCHRDRSSCIRPAESYKVLAIRGFWFSAFSVLTIKVPRHFPAKVFWLWILQHWWV
jgi:hypothetical protein